jgi:hypothetical protein
MGKLWCEGFPTVSLPASEIPTPLTLILPYYQNPDFLRTQVEGWRNYGEVLRRYLSVIVVDDGSPVPATLPSSLPVSVRLFRIEVDLRWNWLAARNIGASHAQDGWLLLTDMDHVLPEATLRAIVYGRPDPHVVYAFARQEHTGQAIGPHSASFLMTKAMFWKIGGYDERLSGHYGTDGSYRRRLAKVAPIHLLKQSLIRYEYQGDSSTTNYKRKQPEDAAVARLIAGFPRGSKPTHLTYPYHEVVA